MKITTNNAQNVSLIQITYKNRMIDATKNPNLDPILVEAIETSVNNLPMIDTRPLPPYEKTKQNTIFKLELEKECENTIDFLTEPFINPKCEQQQNIKINLNKKIIKTDISKTQETITLLTKGLNSQENSLEPENSVDSLENIKTTIIVNDNFITDSFYQPETHNSQPSTPKTGIRCEINVNDCSSPSIYKKPQKTGFF